MTQRTPPITAAVAPYPPIMLDELVRDAALMTRMDRKYLVPLPDAVAIIGALDPDTRALEIAGRRLFDYHSTYFDTADHVAYRLTAHRRRRRFKIRTRRYINTGTCFLEVKTKDGRGNTVKSRMDYAPSDHTFLTPAGRAFTSEALREQGHQHALVDQLQAGAAIGYRRATLLLPGGSRATVDTDLHWSDGPHRQATLTDHVIIESKSIGRVSSLDRALWRAGHRPTGISKFATGTAMLHPELPCNKWARTLRGPLAYAPHRVNHYSMDGTS